MKKTLSRSEMLRLWRTIREAEPLRLDCTVERADGPDYEAALEAEMRAWYLALLDSAPESMLAPLDLAAQARVSEGGGLTLVEAPADCRRILRVGFAGWGAPLEPRGSAAEAGACAANPFFRRPMAAPVGPRMVAVCGAKGKLSSLVCVVDHGEQSYVFDDSAIKTIETYGNQH